jgi:hypothetical protein
VIRGEDILSGRSSLRRFASLAGYRQQTRE